MNNRVETGRKPWRAALLAGGATAVPRWTLDPAPGVVEHVTTFEDDLAAAVRWLADGLQLLLHSVADMAVLLHRGHAPGPPACSCGS
jgi:hypothetical protein